MLQQYIEGMIKDGFTLNLRDLIIERTDWSWTNRPEYYQDMIHMTTSRDEVTIEYEEPLNYIALGRPPGSFPPRDAIEDWVYRNAMKFDSSAITNIDTFVRNVRYNIFEYGIPAKQQIYFPTQADTQQILNIVTERSFDKTVSDHWISGVRDYNDYY